MVEVLNVLEIINHMSSVKKYIKIIIKNKNIYWFTYIYLINIKYAIIFLHVLEVIIKLACISTSTVYTIKN